jgi:hypothetical protein
MDALPKIERHGAAIRNAGYMVRHYPRPGQRAQRAAAIHALGLACRAAFNDVDDFEPLLVAIVDALAPHDERRF